MKQNLARYFRQNWLGLVKSLTIMLVIASFAPAGDEVLKVYVQKGRHMGVQEDAQVSALRDYTSMMRVDSLYTQGSKDCYYNWPPRSLDEYVRFRSMNEDHQQGLAKAGREASAQDTSGMDETSYYTWMKANALKDLLAQYQAAAVQEFKEPAVTAAWQKHVADQLKYKHISSPTLDWGAVIWKTILGWLAASLWTALYLSIKTKAMGYKLWCEWVRFHRLPLASLIFILSLVFDIFPFGEPSDQLRFVKKTIGIYLAGILSLFAAAIGNAQTSTTKTSKKSNVVVIDWRQSGVAAGGPNPLSETTVRVYISNGIGLAETLATFRNDRAVMTALGGRWFRPDSHIELAPYGGLRVIAVQGRSTDLSLIAGSKISAQIPFGKKFSGSLVVPALQVERSLTTGRSSFATVYQSMINYKPWGLSVGAEYSFRQQLGANPITYVGPVAAKRFSGTGRLRSWVAEFGAFRENNGAWRARGRLVFTFGF